MNSGFSTYVNHQSFLHRLNPSLKIVWMSFAVVMVFLPMGLFGQAILLLVCWSLWISAKLSWRAMWDIIKSVILMFAILLFVNWIAYKTPGFAVDVTNHAKIIFNISSLWEQCSWSNHLYYWTHGVLFGGQTYPITTVKPLDGQFVSQKAADGTIFYLAYTSHWYTLSSQAFIYTLYVSLKIYLMIVIITLIISTTNPIQLSFAIEDILNPLKIFKIPVNEWSMTISIALRFVPSLLIESQRILRAQASRGVDFNNGNFKDKIKALVSLVVPMFSIAFYKADDLANAMEARSYNPRYARTRYRNYQITVKDWIIFFFICILLGLSIYFVVKNVMVGPFAFFDAIIIHGA